MVVAAWFRLIETNHAAYSVGPQLTLSPQGLTLLADL